MQQPFFGAMGCTSAIVFTCFGAAYGTAKAGVGISAMGVLRPDLIVKSTFTSTQVQPSWMRHCSSRVMPSTTPY
jgi:hypothetical protein